MPSLIQVGQEIEIYQEILNQLEDAEEAEAEPELIQQAIANITKLQDQQDKIINKIVAAIKEAELLAELRTQEAQNYQRLAKEDKNRSLRLKSFLLQYCNSQRIKKLKVIAGNISVGKPGGKPALKIRDGVMATQIPVEYQKITIEIDKAKIREALEKGKLLDFAYIKQPSDILRIK